MRILYRLLKCQLWQIALMPALILNNDFLVPKSILPEKIIYTNPLRLGYAIWYTAPQKVHLLFKKKTGILSGDAWVPAMVWKANKEELAVYAIQTKGKPDADTPLFHAPFFNIYKTGKVCMGTVDIEIDKDFCLEDFIEQWESYFWNSYFSHLLDNFSPVKTKIGQLWQQQVNTDKPFPSDALIKYGKTLKDLIQ